MGNRAVITTEEHRIGIYLHWNGGRDSVEAFLEYCRLHGYRRPEDDDYGWARLCQVICNFIGADGCSAGIETFDRLDSDNGDNGTYVIKDWRIVARECFDGEEQQEYDLNGFLHEIDSSMPEPHRIGPEMIDDLTRAGTTLDELGCDYFYNIWKKKGHNMSGFEVGGKYGSGGASFTVLRRTPDGIIDVDTANGTGRLKVFRWKDGRESVTVDTPQATVCVTSCPE